MTVYHYSWYKLLHKANKKFLIHSKQSIHRIYIYTNVGRGTGSRDEKKGKDSKYTSATFGKQFSRELHGDRYLYPSPTVPVTLIPIPTPIPATSFNIVPVSIIPAYNCLHPHPSPHTTVPIPISFRVGRFKSMRFKSRILNRDLSQLIFCQKIK